MKSASIRGEACYETEIRRLTTLLRECKEVVGFYAKNDNWIAPSSFSDVPGEMTEYQIFPSKVQKDGGAKARTLTSKLAEFKEVQGGGSAFNQTKT
jgi:hypothetical protein